MEFIEEFILNYETVLFNPKFNGYGEIHTWIVENNQFFLVKKSPTDLMDANLQYYGSSLKGASKGARKILGSGSMAPIVVNIIQGVYWFPGKSPFQTDCLWFALHHIKDYDQLEKGKTRISFMNGCTLDLNISTYSFDGKVKNAYLLKGKVEDRANDTTLRISESSAIYHFKKDDQDINYYFDEYMNNTDSFSYYTY